MQQKSFVNIIFKGFNNEGMGNKHTKDTSFNWDFKTDMEDYDSRWQVGLPNTIMEITQVDLSMGNDKHIRGAHYRIIRNEKLQDNSLIRGGEMEKQSRTWDVIKNSEGAILKESQKRIEFLIDTLITERQMRDGVGKRDAIFSLYSNGLLETNDVLRVANMDFFDFREYLNEHKIPFRYESDFDDGIGGFGELL